MIPTEYYRTIRRNPFLVGYWRMNEPSGTVSLDWAGKYNLNGIYNGTVTNGVPLINNDSSALSKSFEAVAKSNLEIPYSIPLDLVENFTIEAWIISRSEKQTGAILGKNYILEPTIERAAPYYLGLKEGKVRFELGSGTESEGHKGIFLTSPSIIPVGIPTYIAATYYNENITNLFINGALVASGTKGGVVPKNDNFPIYIGTLFKGDIGESALYSQPISEITAKRHFAIGRQTIYKKKFYPQYDVPSYS